MHVCIPSKGRPNTASYKLLQNDGIAFTHFVEPQDAVDYAAANVPNLVVLSANNQGIAFVRNAILDWTRHNRHDWIWMMDDDVSGFGTAKAGKTIKGDASVLQQVHERLAPFRYPVNGINYCQYAWSYSTKPKRFAVNKRPAEVCTLLFVPKITWQYRPRLNLKEDRDFCMQAVQNSDGIIIDLFSWFNCPGVGTNPGGLQTFYRQQRDHEAAAKLAAEWAPFTKLVKKKDRVDCKLDIAGFAKSLERQVK